MQEGSSQHRPHGSSSPAGTNHPRTEPRDSQIPRRIAWVLFAIAALLVISRAPDLLLRPRLWAEEGTVYFRYGYEQGGSQMLVFFNWQAGYLHLVMNFVVAAGLVVGVESWALVSTLVSLALILAPAAILCFGRSELWPSALGRAGAIAVLYMHPSLRDEVWLNALNSQVWCGIIAFTFLAEDWSRLDRLSLAWHIPVLLLCILSGPYAAMLCPLLAIKGLARWSNRTRSEILFGLSAVAGLLLHLAMVVSHGGGTNEKRLWPSPGALLDSLPPALELQLWAPLEQGPVGPAIAGLLVALALFSMRRKVEVLGFAAGLSVTLGTTALALGGLAGGRYAVVPALIVHASLSAILLRPTARLWQQAAGVGLVIVVVVAGVARFGRGHYWAHTESTTSWAEEVAIWRADPSYKPRLWPQDKPQWVVPLTPPEDED